MNMYPIEHFISLPFPIFPSLFHRTDHVILIFSSHGSLRRSPKNGLKRIIIIRNCTNTNRSHNEHSLSKTLCCFHTIRQSLRLPIHCMFFCQYTCLTGLKTTSNMQQRNHQTCTNNHNSILSYLDHIL